MSSNSNFDWAGELALKLQGVTARVTDVESYVLAQVSTGHSRTITPTARTDVDRIDGLDELTSSVAGLLKSTTDSLTRTLRAVARRRNEFVDINSLPEEILRPIFFRASGDNMYRKFAIVDTCALWRNVCLAFPGFWTNFEVPQAYAVASRAFAVAARAGLPLHLRIDWKAAPYKVIHLVDAYGKLVEHLEITEWSSRYQVDPLSATFPILRNLHVQAESTHMMFDSISADLVPRGKLKELVLVGCHLADLPPTSYAGLTRLILVHSCQQDSQFLAHVVDLMEVLRACPDLEELILRRPALLPADNVLDLHSDTATASLISLPHLRYLDLMLYPDVMTYLLARLRTSPVLSALVLAIDIPQSFLNRQAEENLAAVRDGLLCLPSRECFPMLSAIEGLFVHHTKTPPWTTYSTSRQGPASAIVRKAYAVPFLSIDLIWNVHGTLHTTLVAAYTNLFASIANHHHMLDLSRVSLCAGASNGGEPYLSPSSLDHIMPILATAPNVVELEVKGFIIPTGVVEVFFPCVRSTPMLGELRRLIFATCELSEQAVDQLAEGITHMPKLEMLELVRYRSIVDVAEIERRLRRDGLTVRCQPQPPEVAWHLSRWRRSYFDRHQSSV